MNYVRSLVYSFFIVFFANYLIPGVDVVNQTKLPHIGGDLIFAAALGFLNSLIVPLLKSMDGYLTIVRISIAALILNFAAYALLKLLPLGVFITNVEGYVIVALVVSIASILLNFIEMRRIKHAHHHTHEEPHM